MRRRLALLAAVLAAAVAALLLLPGEPAPVGAPAPPSAPGAPAAAPAAPSGASLSGRVEREGRPVAGARVVLRGAEVREAASAADGTFAFPAVGAEPQYLSAADAQGASEVAGPFELPPGGARSGVVLTLAPAVQLEGVVVELLGRRPVEGAWVKGPSGAQRTGASGRFGLAAAPGPGWLEVTAPGYLPRQEWLALDAPRAGGRLEVVLTPVSRLSGRVLEAGAPVAGAAVWTERLEGGARGERSAAVLTAADGAFSLEGPGGLLRVWAVTPAGARVTGPVLRLAVGEARAGLVLDGGAPSTAEGVVRKGGAPLAGAQLLALAAATEAVVGTTTSGPDGRFTFPALLRGRYLVQVHHGPLAALLGPFEQRAGGPPWELVLGAGEALAGRVEPAAAGVRVRWRSGGWSGPPEETLTDASGRFRFEGLPPGEVALEAEGPPGAATARARPGDEVVLRLQGGVVVVHLQDDTGAPVTDGVLLARSLDTGAARQLPVLAPGGHTRLELPFGAWELSLEAAGRGRSAAARLTVGPSPLDVRLSLEASVAVEGVVRDADTLLPLAGVEISALGGSDRGMPRVVVLSDARGGFAVPPVPRSSQLVSHHPAYLPRSRAAAEGARWDLTLARAPHQLPARGELQFEGVGLQLDGSGPSVRVAKVNEGGPAERAGVLAGDVLVAVDGAPTTGVPLQQTVGRIRGPAGTEVRLTLERAGQRLEVAIRRRQLVL